MDGRRRAIPDCSLQRTGISAKLANYWKNSSGLDADRLLGRLGVADQQTHRTAEANRLGRCGPSFDIQNRATRHDNVGTSKRTPIVGG